MEQQLFLMLPQIVDEFGQRNIPAVRFVSLPQKRFRIFVRKVDVFEGGRKIVNIDQAVAYENKKKRFYNFTLYIVVTDVATGEMQKMKSQLTDEVRVLTISIQSLEQFGITLFGRMW